MALTRYAVFLRGVNVGGVNLKMAEVAAALTGAGFSQVRTVLASGNVLLDSPDGATVVRAAVAAALRERFGYHGRALVYEIDKVRDIVAGFPFEPEVDGYHSYVTFVAEAAALDELTALAGQAGPDEKVAGGDHVIYWQVPKGKTLDSTIGKTMGNKNKSCTTTRNLRTLVRVLNG